MKYLKEKFSKEQLFIIATVLCLSTPFYICVPILLVETIYLFYTKKITNAFKNTPKSKYLIIFVLISTKIIKYLDLGVFLKAFVIFLV